ncbi:MAG: hypothetical protein AB8H79_19635 [Myxococcota bacterium]
MYRHSRYLTTLASAALASLASAQNPQSIFVKVGSGPSATGGFSPTDPLPTLAEGIDAAKNLLAQGITQVTLRGLPGTYSTTAPMPAHGITLTAYDLPGGTGALPILTNQLVVNSLGNSALPASTIEHLEFEAGITLDSGGEVQIRHCRFSYEQIDPQSSFGAVSTTRPVGSHSEHVIEFCQFEPKSAAPSQRNAFTGIRNKPSSALQGSSSLLIRANEFRNIETAVLVEGDINNQFANTTPRVFSNTMSLHERAASFEFSNPWFVNNSIYEFKAHNPALTTLNDDVYGVRFSECPTYSATNNIIWFAPSAGVDRGDLFFEFSGVGTILTNELEDNGAPNPWAGSTPVFPRIDMASPLATGGSLFQVIPASSGGPAPVPNGAGGTVPVDVSIDFEGDMRSTPVGANTLPAVAIGADQVVDLRISIVPGPTIDAYGNWYGDPSLTPTSPFTVHVQGALPGIGTKNAAIALLGVVLPNPQPLALNPVDQHVFVGFIGSSTSSDLASTNVVPQVMPAAQLLGNGVTTTSFAVPGIQVPAARIGIKFYFQAISVGPVNGDPADGTLRGIASNRLELRVNR